MKLISSGLLFAQGECDRLLGPVLEQNKFKRYSIFWVLSNLFRRVAAQDSQGKVTSQSPYPELEEAKRRHPIPDSAFYKGTDVSLHAKSMAFKLILRSDTHCRRALLESQVHQHIILTGLDSRASITTRQYCMPLKRDKWMGCLGTCDRAP